MNEKLNFYDPLDIVKFFSAAANKFNSTNVVIIFKIEHLSKLFIKFIDLYFYAQNYHTNKQKTGNNYIYIFDNSSTIQICNFTPSLKGKRFQLIAYDSDINFEDIERFIKPMCVGIITSFKWED